MATTTPNYGWDVPTSTDYVADGAVAIETLGDDIDASLFSITGGKDVGFVHLNTTNFSASSGVSINNVFSATYKAYKIILSNMSVASSTQNINMRLRVAGVDAGSNYNDTGYISYIPGSVLQFAGGTGGGNCIIGTANVTHRSGSVTELQNPALAVATTMQTQRIYYDGSNYYGANLSIIHTTTTAYDGFTIFPNASTMTGTVSVYGYRSS